MPRRHRREPDNDDFTANLDRLKAGFRRREVKRGAAYTVQPISAEGAQKDYICPGCSLTITPGVAHVVVWREDSILGDDRAVADRRHWHSHCWRIF